MPSDLADDQRRIPSVCVLLLAVVFVSGSIVAAPAAEPAVNVSHATKDEAGFLVHSVTSPYQSGTTTIRVLLPERLEEDKKYPVLFVLPVEAKDGTRYGDGLLAVKNADLHVKHGLICVAPTFSQLPWYADHPTDKAIRQETYFLKVVVPFVERSYPALGNPEERLLVGFSKSGWGAYTLLLRHPDVFGRAAAWDAPLMKDKPDQFGMGPIFGTQENFENYEVTALLKKRADELKTQRLVLTGYGNFRAHHQKVHRLMEGLAISCAYRDGPQRKHRWDSGWLEEAVGLLVSDDSG